MKGGGADTLDASRLLLARHGAGLGWVVSGIVIRFVARPLLMELEQLAAGSVRLSPRAAWQSFGLPGCP